MPMEDNHRETGARTLKERTGPDPRDDISQNAAENKKPGSGMGLTQAPNEFPDTTGQSEGQDQRPTRLRVKRWGTKRRYSL